MKITHTDIYRFSIPIHPFTIATGTMLFAQNMFVRVFTDAGIHGVGECSAFPMIVGETQNTCLEMAKDFAALWSGKDALAIPERMAELHAFTAYNSTAKSAFDMALYDIASKHAGQPLFQFLGGVAKKMETDLTVGIDTPEQMAKQAVQYKQQGVRIIKVKLGKEPADDIERIRCIREAVGENLQLRIDANQGWSYDGALAVLAAVEKYSIAFCEQPMRRYNDHLLPALKQESPIAIMADESVFDHHDAERIIKSGGCHYVNIKLSKSSGILEALKISEVCRSHSIPCMMGGMLESRLALTAFAHFASSQDNIVFYDMDTCMLGHKVDPVTGGVRYNNYFVELPHTPGIGADVDETFLAGLEKLTV